jgi:hypothetical protein
VLQIAPTSADLGLPAIFVGRVQVRVRPSVFNERFIDFEAAAGGTIEEILAGAGLSCPEGLDGIAWIDGRRLDRRYWHRVRPKAGTVVGIAFVPKDARTDPRSEHQEREARDC